MSRIKVVKTHIPKFCYCPSCGLKQPFKKYHEHWKTVKDFDLDGPILLKVQVISAKCLNPKCSSKSFSLPVKGITKFQRATDRVIREGIVSNIIDNIPSQKIKDRFSRSLNTTGSRPTIERWKHREADSLNFKDLIRQLSPSRILCLDDLDPKRSKNKALITSDRIKGYNLYVDTVKSQNKEEVVKYLNKLKELGIEEVDCFIIDMWKSFPYAIKEVYPKAKIQYDYFHIWQDINRHLEGAVREYCKFLREDGFNTLATDLWKHRKVLLVNPNNPKKMTEKIRQKIQELVETHKGTIVEDVLTLKGRIRDIFENSKTQNEAHFKKNQLYYENWYKKSLHFKKIIQLFMWPPYCYNMFTYLKEPDVPRSGNPENAIKVVRSWEKVRYGFRTIKGLQDHLKLYQRAKYLRQF